MKAMLRSIDALKGYTIGATDGDIGQLVDLFFDDQGWTVRYLVIDTGGWLAGRRVLISPVSLGKVDWQARQLNAALTRQEVENSPNIDIHKPVSRQHEAAYCDYYDHPYYWVGPYLWGPAAFPRGIVTSSTTEGKAHAAREPAGAEDVHSRSTNEVTNYSFEAKDGEIGQVNDFVIDEDNWTIRYIIVDTRNWWPGKKVLVSPEWITSVSWTESKAYADLSREAIRNGPQYNPSEPIDRQYESRLYEHYGRPRYWSF